jgi:hypothetical protein
VYKRQVEDETPTAEEVQATIAATAPPAQEEEEEKFDEDMIQDDLTFLSRIELRNVVLAEKFKIKIVPSMSDDTLRDLIRKEREMTKPIPHIALPGEPGYVVEPTTPTVTETETTPSDTTEKKVETAQERINRLRGKK